MFSYFHIALDKTKTATSENHRGVPNWLSQVGGQVLENNTTDLQTLQEERV